MIFTDLQLDVLTEIINVGVGKSAGQLNKLLGKRVHLHVPTVEIISGDEFLKRMQPDRARVSSINMSFHGSVTGVAELIFPTKSVQAMLDLIIDESAITDDLDQLRSSTLSEIGNIILNSLIGTVANEFKVRLSYSIPVYSEGRLYDLSVHNCTSDTNMIVGHTRFSVVDMDIEGTFLLNLEINSCQNLLGLIDCYRKDHI